MDQPVPPADEQIKAPAMLSDPVEVRYRCYKIWKTIRKKEGIPMKGLLEPARLIVVFAMAASAAAGTYELKLAPANVHWGYYDSRLKPVLRIASGDTVRIETMVAGGLERMAMAGVSSMEIPASLKEVESAVTDRGPGVHPLTGPIYVEGAGPGDVLEVRILGFEFLHPFGVTGFRPGTGTLPDEFPYARSKRIPIDAQSGWAEFSPAVRLKLAPFWGSVGVAPPPPIHRLSSGPPGAHAGNLDNKELVAGSTIYLPVHVPGALISMGDGHALQGDGEVTITALETSLRGTVQVFVRKGKQIRWPRAETPTTSLRWVCILI